MSDGESAPDPSFRLLDLPLELVGEVVWRTSQMDKAALVRTSHYMSRFIVRFLYARPRLFPEEPTLWRGETTEQVHRVTARLTAFLDALRIDPRRYDMVKTLTLPFNGYGPPGGPRSPLEVPLEMLNTHFRHLGGLSLLGARLQGQPSTLSLTKLAQQLKGLDGLKLLSVEGYTPTADDLAPSSTFPSVEMLEILFYHNDVSGEPYRAVPWMVESFPNVRTAHLVVLHQVASPPRALAPLSRWQNLRRLRVGVLERRLVPHTRSATARWKRPAGLHGVEGRPRALGHAGHAPSLASKTSPCHRVL